MSKPVLRCAVYTRKSTEEGLEQDYNSLHAQRDACEAYIKSQAGEGWKVLATAYDDGGISGGTMERNGLKALLADIAAGRIDVVVVYKVDRLTRSLADFARIIEVFDKHRVSFVSVTQSFNTTTSMGRLTLNVLLSFAQFEREVTGERIRDKIAQSKAKGMWMGGCPPLGYDPKGRSLEVNETEAELVRHIFRRYLELDSVRLLWTEMRAEGRLSKSWTTKAGRTLGGQLFERGALTHILKNRTYIGMIPHRKQAYPGHHAPIVDQAIFDQVQQRLKAKRRRGTRRPSEADDRAMFIGRVFDDDGVLMTPTKAFGRRGGAYRYYVSRQNLTGHKGPVRPDSIRRLPAKAFETLVRQVSIRLFPDHSDPTQAIARIEVHPRSAHVAFDPSLLAGAPREARLLLEAAGFRLAPDETAESDAAGLWWVRLDRRLKFRGGRSRHSQIGVTTPRPDHGLIRNLRKAHDLLAECIDANGSFTQAPADAHHRILVRLAFLSPELQADVLAGRQPSGLRFEAIRRQRLPLCWDDQRTAFE